MSGTTLLALPVELLLEIAKITDRMPTPPSFQKPAPPPSPSLFQLPPMLTPGSAPFTPLGRIADTGTANGGDYFGNLAGGDVGGFVLGGPDGGSRAASRRGSILEANNLLRPDDRRGSENLLSVPGSRRPSITTSALSSQPDKHGSQSGMETVRTLSEVSKELRERLWPLLLGTITLDLRKVKDILSSPAADAFAQTVRHLQVDLYPNDPTSLDDISAFLRIVHTHLYSLQLRFHPLPPASATEAKGKGKEKGRRTTASDPSSGPNQADPSDGEVPSGTVEPRRKVFHLPSIIGYRGLTKSAPEPAFPELQTLRLKGFGFTSSLEANILQEAPNLCTIDIACQPVSLSRGYDIIEILKTYCPLLENIRLEIDLGSTTIPYLATSEERRNESGRELWSFVKQVFLPVGGSSETSQRMGSSEARPGSLRRLRSLDLLCKDFTANISVEEWDALAKVIVQSAPKLRRLQLPVNPGLDYLSSEPEYSDDTIERRRQAERIILGSLLSLGDSISVDDSINADEATPSRPQGTAFARPPAEQHTTMRTFAIPPSPALHLEHLEYLEFKVGSERRQTIIDPFIHPDDHPFHSRILPPEQKVDEDPGRIGRFVASGIAAAPVQPSSEPGGVAPVRTGEQLNVPISTWRWESSGKLLECEHYTVWTAIIERTIGHPRFAAGAPVDVSDVDMDRGAASGRSGKDSSEVIRVTGRQSAHHRW